MVLSYVSMQINLFVLFPLISIWSETIFIQGSKDANKCRKIIILNKNLQIKAAQPPLSAHVSFVMSLYLFISL